MQVMPAMFYICLLVLSMSEWKKIGYRSLQRLIRINEGAGGVVTAVFGTLACLALCCQGKGWSYMLDWFMALGLLESLSQTSGINWNVGPLKSVESPRVHYYSHENRVKFVLEGFPELQCWFIILISLSFLLNEIQKAQKMILLIYTALVDIHLSPGNGGSLIVWKYKYENTLCISLVYSIIDNTSKF